MTDEEFDALRDWIRAEIEASKYSGVGEASVMARAKCIQAEHSAYKLLVPYVSNAILVSMLNKYEAAGVHRDRIRAIVARYNPDLRRKFAVTEIPQSSRARFLADVAALKK